MKHGHVSSTERKRGKRKPLPSNLPREVVVIDLPEDEKKSFDGRSLVLRCVGKEVSEKLEYQPSVLKAVSEQLDDIVAYATKRRIGVQQLLEHIAI